MNLLFSSCLGLLSRTLVFFPCAFLPPSLSLPAPLSLFVSLSFSGLGVRRSLTLWPLPFPVVLPTHMEERTGFEKILTEVHSCNSALHLHRRTNAPLSLSFCLYLCCALSAFCLSEGWEGGEAAMGAHKNSSGSEIDKSGICHSWARISGSM